MSDKPRDMSCDEHWREALDCASERPARDYGAALEELAASSRSVPPELAREQSIHAALGAAFASLEIPEDGAARVASRLMAEPRPFGFAEELGPGPKAPSESTDELAEELRSAYDAVPVPKGLLERLTDAIDREPAPELPKAWWSGAGDARLPLGELSGSAGDSLEPEVERGRLFLGPRADADVKAAGRTSRPETETGCEDRDGGR